MEDESVAADRFTTEFGLRWWFPAAIQTLLWYAYITGKAPPAALVEWIVSRGIKMTTTKTPRTMMLGISTLGIVLLVLLLLLLLGAFPAFPHAASFGYGPFGIVGILIIVLIILLVMGKL